MKRSYLKLISTSLLVSLALSLTLSGCSSSDDTETTKEEYTPVEVAAVKLDTIYNTTMITGKIQGKTDVSIVPKIAGKVSEVLVKVGQDVKAGDTIAILDKADLQDRVEQAKASLDTASVGVEQAKGAVSSAQVGVKQAQVALQQAKDSIKSIQAAYNLAKASYDANYEKIQNAKLNLERSKTLYEQGIISKVELEQAELAASNSNVNVLEAQLAQARESLNQSNNGVKQAEVGVEQAQAAYNQALKGVKQAEAGYNQAKIVYDQTVNALKDAVITSPIDGVVYSVNVDSGEIASAAAPIATVTSIDKAYAKVDVTEKLLVKLTVGSKINVDIPSVSSKKFQGIITSINPVANVQNNLYSVEVEIENKDHIIKPGMFAKVEFRTDYKDNVMVINSEAVTTNGDKKVVYVEENGKAVERVVETGLDNGEYVEITKGLKVGDKVIIKGQEFLENADKVKVVGGAK